jgi:hypothetical protein
LQGLRSGQLDYYDPIIINREAGLPLEAGAEGLESVSSIGELREESVRLAPVLKVRKSYAQLHDPALNREPIVLVQGTPLLVGDVCPQVRPVDGDHHGFGDQRPVERPLSEAFSPANQFEDTGQEHRQVRTVRHGMILALRAVNSEVST